MKRRYITKRRFFVSLPRPASGTKKHIPAGPQNKQTNTKGHVNSHARTHSNNKKYKKEWKQRQQSRIEGQPNDHPLPIFVVKNLTPIAYPLSSIPVYRLGKPAQSWFSVMLSIQMMFESFLKFLLTSAQRYARHVVKVFAVCIQNCAVTQQQKKTNKRHERRLSLWVYCYNSQHVVGWMHPVPRDVKKIVRLLTFFQKLFKSFNVMMMTTTFRV